MSSFPSIPAAQFSSFAHSVKEAGVAGDLAKGVAKGAWKGTKALGEGTWGAAKALTGGNRLAAGGVLATGAIGVPTVAAAGAKKWQQNTESIQSPWKKRGIK